MKLVLKVLNILLETESKDAYINVWLALRILLSLAMKVAFAFAE